MSARSGYVFPAPGSAPEPDRALYPDREGFAERDGVRLFWEVYGEGNSPTVMMVSGWHLPARVWKHQIPYLGRHFRIIAFDQRGTGRSSRPRGARAYMTGEQVKDMLAVMEATGTETVIPIAKSRGAVTAMSLAGDHPERTLATVAIGPDLPLTSYLPREVWQRTFWETRRWRQAASALAAMPRALAALRVSPGMRVAARRLGSLGLLRTILRVSRRGILEDEEAFLDWWVKRMVVPDRHSTRQVECLADWYRQTGSPICADAAPASAAPDPHSARELVARVDHPLLVISGDQDLVTPHEWAEELTRMTGGQLMTITGCGHATAARYPAIVNIALRGFIESVAAGEARAERPTAAYERELQATGGGRAR